MNLETFNRGQGLRSWIPVDASGNSQIIEADKFTMMRRCDLPAHALRLLDPLFKYPSMIIGRGKAIVVKFEKIRCIITADEVLLLNSLDSDVSQYVEKLQLILSSPRYLPFEFRVLEVALETACTSLDSQVKELETEAYPLLDELTSKISTLNLERLRRLKVRLVALTRRVQKVRDEIEQLMDDDEDMAEMYLTEKKRRMESSFRGDQSISAPVSPVSSPPDSRRLEKKSFSIARSRHESMRSSESTTESIEELEMLLEAYFVVIDGTLDKLISDNVRNQLIQFDLLLTTASFVFGILGVVVGVFGMNFPVPMFDNAGAFKWVLIILGICGIFIFSAFVWFLNYRRLLPRSEARI